MITNVRNGTEVKSSDLDRELVEVLISISKVSKRIADRLTSGDGKERRGERHGRIIYTQRRNQEMR